MSRYRRSQIGHLRPFISQNTHVRNDRSQGAADVARCRKRGERSPSRLPKMGDATQHEQLIERQLVKESKWRYRPTAAGRLSAKQTFNESGLIDDRGEQRQPCDQSATRPHWITSSARSSTDCGIVMPSAFAVFMLITRSNLVGCRTGKSAGLAPLRIRPVYTPAWRCTSGRLTP